MSTAQEPATHMHIPRLSIDGWASWGMLCGIILAFDAIPQGKLAFEIAVCWLLAAVLLPHVVDHLDTLKAAALAPIHEHQLTLPQLDARSARGLSRWSTRWAQQRSRIQHALHSDDSPFANGLSAVLAVGLTLALATYLGRLPTLFASSAIAICAILAITSKYRQPNVNGGLQKGIVIALAWALCASLDSPMTLVDLAQTALAGLLLTGHLCLKREGRWNAAPWLVVGAAAVALLLYQRQVWPAACGAMLWLARLAIGSKGHRNTKRRLSASIVAALLMIIALAGHFWSL